MRKFQVAPKPFDIVPFESDSRKQRLTGHDHFSNQFTGKAVLQLKALSPLHIGSGIWEIINEDVVRDFVTSNSKEVIPGSSLKGIFRTIAETISPSCVCKTRQQNLPYANLKECKVKDEKSKICPTCAIFGAMGYKGRVSFTDASLLKGDIGLAKIPSLYGPRSNAQIYKDNQGRCKGRKFYFHGKPTKGKEPIIVIVSGAVLEFEMNFENISENEFGLLLTSLGIIGGLVPKIGGAKPVCLGSIEVMLKRLELRQLGSSFFVYSSRVDRYEGNKLSAYLMEIDKKENPLILKKSLQKLNTIWKYPPERECPNIAY